MTLTIAPTEEDWAAWLRESKQSRSGKWDFYGGMTVIGLLVGAFTYLLTKSSVAAFTAALTGAALLVSLKPVAFRLELHQFLRQVQKHPQAIWTVTIQPGELQIQTDTITLVFLPKAIQEIYTGSEGSVYMVLQEEHWPIPPSSFASSTERTQFLEALQHLQETSASRKVAWWTAETPQSLHAGE
ncbi:MAG: hypothetical protein QM758_20540 [Armatimonas sp.]